MIPDFGRTQMRIRFDKMHPSMASGAFFIIRNFNKTETKQETFANISSVGYGHEVRKHEK